MNTPINQIALKFDMYQIWNLLLWHWIYRVIDMCGPWILSSVHRYLEQIVLRCFIRFVAHVNLSNTTVSRSEYDFFHVLNYSRDFLNCEIFELWNGYYLYIKAVVLPFSINQFCETTLHFFCLATFILLI